MSNEQRRKDDNRIETILTLCTNMDKTIAVLQNTVEHEIKNELLAHNNSLYEKGGLCDATRKNELRIDNLEDKVKSIPMIAGWIFTGVTVTAGVILWVIEHGKSLIDKGAK